MAKTLEELDAEQKAELPVPARPVYLRPGAMGIISDPHTGQLKWLTPDGQLLEL